MIAVTDPMSSRARYLLNGSDGLVPCSLGASAGAGGRTQGADGAPVYPYVTEQKWRYSLASNPRSSAILGDSHIASARSRDYQPFRQALLGQMRLDPVSASSGCLTRWSSWSMTDKTSDGEMNKQARVAGGRLEIQGWATDAQMSCVGSRSV
jgi:hypothetical protein